nr:hypothetical protein [Tanacetum cinerariifolium]
NSRKLDLGFRVAHSAVAYDDFPWSLGLNWHATKPSMLCVLALRCHGCGQPCDGYYCESCMCPQCGMPLFNGICDNCIYGAEMPIICTSCGGIVRGGLCLPCDLREKDLYNYDPNAYSFNNSNYFPQPHDENYLCNLCGNNSHDGYDCQQQFSFVYEQEPSYNQNYDDNYYPHESPSYPCFDYCGGSHETFQCQPDNQNNLLPIPSECEVTLEDKMECDVLICENSSTINVCDNHSEILFDSNNDDLSSDDESFKDIEYVDASVPDPAIASVEEENVVQREEEEVDLKDISQVQDVVLREKLFSITRLISNIKSLNDNATPDCVFNSFESDNSLLDNFLPEFETFCDNSKETRSGNTTHANYSLPEYDSFCFEIEPDQERLINLMKNDIPDDLSNDPLLEEVDLFLSDNSIPPGIENFADDPEGDIRFLEELLINDSILSHESSDSNFEDNLSNSRPLPKPPDDNFDLEPEVISVVMEDNDEPDEYFNPGGEIFVSTNNEDVDYFPFMFVIRIFLPYLILSEISPLFLFAESEDTIFDPGLSLGD